MRNRFMRLLQRLPQVILLITAGLAVWRWLMLQNLPVAQRAAETMRNFEFAVILGLDSAMPGMLLAIGLWLFWALPRLWSRVGSEQLQAARRYNEQLRKENEALLQEQTQFDQRIILEREILNYLEAQLEELRRAA